jgi:uncharacterized protein with gpF-like domain
VGENRKQYTEYKRQGKAKRIKVERRSQDAGARMKEAQGSGLKVQGKETLVAKALVTLMAVHKENLSSKG